MTTNYEYASIENKTDYKNLLKYIKEGSFDVEVDEEGFIYVENYKIEVMKGFEDIYDEIEKIFNPVTDFIWEYQPEQVIEVQGFSFAIY